MKKFLTVFFISLQFFYAFGYEINTHLGLTRNALTKGVPNLDAFLRTLNLAGPSVN